MTDPDHWLLLMHRLPPKPAYLRVKVARRLQRIGAVAVKNTVYVLPATDQALEDLQWTVRDIRASGGEANLCESRFIDGLTSGDIRQRFNEARDADYGPLLDEARALAKRLRRGKRRAGIAEEVAQIARRAEEIRAIDFFSAPEGQTVAALLEEITTQLQGGEAATAASEAVDYRGRVWVSRSDVHVDRMSSAWLIRRFIDPDATFKFVDGKSYRPKEREIRFDMFEAEFTHDGDRCTFEVLIERMRLDDAALRAIGEVIHDIDLRDGKFGRPETAGIAHVVNGIALSQRDDEERLRRSAALMEEIYAAYQRKRG